jgi:hypothetical protein
MGFLSPFLTGYGLQPEQAPGRMQQQRAPMRPQFLNKPSMQPMQAPGSPLAQMPNASNIEVAPERWDTRLNNTFASPLFQTGLSLLGNARNGGDWAQVGQDVRAINSEQQQRRLLEEQQRRQRVQDQRSETTWGRQESQYAAFERLIKGLPEQQRQEALANPEAFMAARAQASAPITPYQQRQLELEEAQMKEAAAARRQQLAYQQSQDQWMRRFQGALGAADAGSVAEQGALVRQGYTQVRPILQEMRSIIERYPDIMGSWVNTQDRTQLVRLAGGDPARLAAMERFQGLATQLTLPQLEALRPATNLDFERIRSTVADPQMSQRGAIAYIDSQLQSLERARQVSESQGQWISQYGSLSLPNAEGQTWASSVQNAPFMQFNVTPESVAGAANTGGPRRGDVVDGYRYMGGPNDNPAERRHWVRIKDGDRQTLLQHLNNGNLR